MARFANDPTAAQNNQGSRRGQVNPTTFGSRCFEKNPTSVLRSRISFAAVIFAVFMFTSLYSAETQAAWTGGTIQNVRVMPNGDISFATVEPMLNPYGCFSTDFYHIVQADAAKQALAVLLAAQAQKVRIAFYMLEGASSCGNTGRPRVADVMITSS